MSTLSSTTTLAASPASFSSSSFASLSAPAHASDADSLARMPLLCASAEEASFMPPVSPSATSTRSSQSVASFSHAPTLVAPVPRYAHLHLHLSRSIARGLSALPSDVDVEEGLSDTRQAARYAARAAQLFDRLAHFSQTDDTLAAQDIRACLAERRSFVGEDALIAVRPQVYIGHDGFYIGAGPNVRQGTTPEHLRALCVLHLGLVEDVELACAQVQDKLDEIHAHLLREGGTDRLVPAAYLRGVRVTPAPFWTHDAARLPVRLARASLFGVAAGLALAPWAGAVWASAGALAVMQLCFWPEHQSALARDAAHKARQSQAWMALLRTERWSAADSFAGPQRAWRSTPEL